MTAARTGVVVSGSVMQSAVEEDFTVEVPVEIQLGRGKTITHWVRTGPEPVEFSVKLPVGVVAGQVKVSLDPGNGVMRR